MGDNKAGNLLLISKKYTENGERIRWNSAGETSLRSGKSIKMTGQADGVTFHKNDPVVLNAAPPFKVLKVTGPASVVNDNTYEFKAVAFSEQATDQQLLLVNWAYSFDSGKTITPFHSGTTRVEKGVAIKSVTVAGNHIDKEVTVYAYFRKPDPKVGALSKIIYLPLVVDIYRLPGLNENGTDIANDMAFGYGKGQRPVYTAGDIAAYTHDYQDNGFDATKHAKYANVAGTSKGVYNTQQTENTGSLMKLSITYPNEQLFGNLRSMANLMARGDLNDNIYSMIDKFERNEGGIYENNALTKAVMNNPSTQRFCTGIEDKIADLIKNAGGELTTVENKTVFFGNESGYESSHPYGHPRFPYSRDNNLLTGLTIAINDMWAYRVSLTSFKQTGDNYKARYEVVLWDHFGLDLPDMEKFYSYGAGFRAWFILQHHRGFKPFLTKVSFTKDFNGNVHEGKSERAKKRNQ